MGGSGSVTREEMHKVKPNRVFTQRLEQFYGWRYICVLSVTVKSSLLTDDPLTLDGPTSGPPDDLSDGERSCLSSFTRSHLTASVLSHRSVRPDLSKRWIFQH